MNFAILQLFNSFSLFFLRFSLVFPSIFIHFHAFEDYLQQHITDSQRARIPLSSAEALMTPEAPKLLKRSNWGENVFLVIKSIEID